MTAERAAALIHQDSAAAGRAVASLIAELIRVRAAEGRAFVLGLSARHSAVSVYEELIRLHRQEGLDLSGVVTFSPLEYWPIDPRAVQSVRSWLGESFLSHVNVPAGSAHFLDGGVSRAGAEAHCRQYERAISEAGGIDVQILGVGPGGQVGLNGPGSGADAATRLVLLDRAARMDAASDFFGEENVPEQGLTVGMATILQARKVCVLAFGEQEAPPIRRAMEGGASPELPISLLRAHPDVTFHLDPPAAADLTRVATPWLAGPCVWDDLLTRHAVIWLAETTGKGILQLADEDYIEHGLGELRTGGGAYRTNEAVFEHLMATITTTPAGDSGPRRIIVFSPHPDDDVISMAGTMMRLAEQGHEVHVAYMVSGFLSVFDHDVARYADFVGEFNRIFALQPEASARIEAHIGRFLRQKAPGDLDTPEVQAIKALIRRTEAIDAARFCGLQEDRIHFLDMPFYNTGKVRKLSVGPGDIAAVGALLEQVRPEVIFGAGDMSDPHGTHRLCQQAGLAALEEYAASGRQRPELWLYRGAWQEWPAEQIDMAVPLSPAELKRKRYAIFRHQSQKDRAMFPGPSDRREFWQRAEDRNIATAALYDRLGLPQYHALEAFVRWPPQLCANTTAQIEKT
ncbi:MAG TPA: PIG-L family deacetylase [Phycisphaerae bacterium]|nr:PIG-L family deacetylase [Phycisphaerae bacterium]